MTPDRRRFFPAKGAQTIPGRVAQVQVQLQPLAKAAAAAPFTADLAGPTLLPEWRYIIGTERKKVADEGYEWALSDPESYYWHWEEVESHIVKHGSGYTMPAAQWSEDGRMTRCWVNLGEIARPLRFRAVLLGRAMRDVQWTANLDTSMPWPAAWRKSLGELWPGGVDVEDEGHSLLIRVHPGTGPQNAGNWAAALTMTASAGGKDVGTLTLHMGWRTKPLAQQLQEDLYDFTGWEGWKPADTQESV